VPKPVVLIAEELAQSAVDVLGTEFEIRNVDGADRGALLPALRDADAILIRSATTIDAEALSAAPVLKVVARAGIGLDNVDVPAATARGVLVVNAPQSNIVTAAEHALALLLAVARNIPAADASLRAGEWKRSRYTGVELADKTVGVVGLGRAGADSLGTRVSGAGPRADRPVPAASARSRPGASVSARICRKAVMASANTCLQLLTTGQLQAPRNEVTVPDEPWVNTAVQT